MYVSMRAECQKNFNNRKISIIKAIREATNLGIKDSREIVERLMAGESVNLPTLDICRVNELSTWGISINNEKPVEQEEFVKALNFSKRKIIDSITSGNFQEADSWLRMIEIIQKLKG